MTKKTLWDSLSLATQRLYKDSGTEKYIKTASEDAIIQDFKEVRSGAKRVGVDIGEKIKLKSDVFDKNRTTDVGKYLLKKDALAILEGTAKPVHKVPNKPINSRGLSLIQNELATNPKQSGFAFKGVAGTNFPANYGGLSVGKTGQGSLSAIDYRQPLFKDPGIDTRKTLKAVSSHERFHGLQDVMRSFGEKRGLTQDQRAILPFRGIEKFADISMRDEELINEAATRFTNKMKFDDPTIAVGYKKAISRPENKSLFEEAQKYLPKYLKLGVAGGLGAASGISGVVDVAEKLAKLKSGKAGMTDKGEYVDLETTSPEEKWRLRGGA